LDRIAAEFASGAPFPPAPGPSSSAWYAPGRTDALGDRLLLFDTAAPPFELLRVAPELSAHAGFADALRARVERLKRFAHPSFARVRSVSTLEDAPGQLTVASALPAGERLSVLLDSARAAGRRPDHAAALWLMRQVLPALSALHALGGTMAHGLVAPDRVVIGPGGSLVITEHVFGSAVAALGRSGRELRERFGPSLLEAPDALLLTARADVTGAALLALGVLLGRPLRADEDLRDVPRLLDRAAPGSPWPGMRAMRGWVLRALSLEGAPFASADEACAALEGVGPDLGRVAAASLLPEASVSAGEEIDARGTLESVGPGLEDAGPASPPPMAPVPPDEAIDDFGFVTILDSRFDLNVFASEDPREPAPAAAGAAARVRETASVLESAQPEVPAPTPDAAPVHVSPPAEAPAPGRDVAPVQAPAPPHVSVPIPILQVVDDEGVRPGVVPPWDLAEARTPREAEPPEPVVAADDARPVPLLARGDAGDRVVAHPLPAAPPYDAPPAPLPVRSEADDRVIGRLQPAVVADDVPPTPLSARGDAEDRAIRDPQPAVRTTAKTTAADSVRPPAPVRRAGLTRQHGDRLLLAGSVALLVLSLLTAAMVVVSTRAPEHPAEPPTPTDVSDEGPDAAGEAPEQEPAPNARRTTGTGSRPASRPAVAGDGRGAARAPANVAARAPATSKPPAPPMVDGRPAGWVEIGTPAGVQMRVNGRLVTPNADGRALLPAGRHTVELSAARAGFLLRREVVVEAGAQAVQRIDVPTGRLALTADAGAEVFIGGASAGHTPLGARALPVGVHQVELRHPELGARQVEVVVREGQETRVSVDMTRW
jgi:hypothetical protein